MNTIIRIFILRQKTGYYFKLQSTWKQLANLRTGPVINLPVYDVTEQL